MDNQTADDIKKGMNAIADGVKEAGRKRTAELVAKNGYVAFRNPDAVAQFHADPYYANWNYTYVDGEYRFFPPKINEKEVTLEQLAPILNEDGYLILGHGTGRSDESDEIINSILKNGLRTKDNSLYYTTIGLDTDNIPLLEQKLDNWEHLNSKKIVLIKIPTEFINMMGNSADLDGERFGAFMKKVTDSNGQIKNYLDPKFIIGYYDVDKKLVELNEKYEKSLSQETIQELRQKYEEIKTKTAERINSQTSNIVEEVKPLKDDLQDFITNGIVGSPNIIRAHKTNADPSTIMQNGLFLNVNNLDSTSNYVTKESYSAVINQFDNWHHGTGQYFIIIDIPKELYQKENRDGIIAFTGEKNNYSVTTEAGAPFKIPSKYIRGYIDMEWGQVYENPNYAFSQNNPNREQEIQKAKQEIEHGYMYDKDGNVKLLDEPSQNIETIEQDPKILETYKETIQDLTKTTFISVNTLKDDPSKCKYVLLTTDKRTGKQEIVQEVIVDFDGKFSMETLPSLYNQVANGFPANDNEKENGIVINNVEMDKMMGFGNLSPSQMQLVKSMKEFVDNQYIGIQQEQKPSSFGR